MDKRPSKTEKYNGVMIMSITMLVKSKTKWKLGNMDKEKYLEI